MGTKEEILELGLDLSDAKKIARKAIDNDMSEEDALFAAQRYLHLRQIISEHPCEFEDFEIAGVCLARHCREYFEKKNNRSDKNMIDFREKMLDLRDRLRQTK